MLRNFLLALFFVGSLPFSLQAQTTEDQARDDLDYNSNIRPTEQLGDEFGARLWYGTGAQLSFGSTQFQSVFLAGLSPIVGYKVNNFLSFGPRGSILYNSFRFQNGTPDPDKFNFVTWEAGLFGRARIINPVFVHVEYSLVNEADRFVGGEVTRITRAIPFAGAGISQGGGIGAAGFEILILIRLSSADRLNDSPVQFRTGLNFNF